MEVRTAAPEHSSCVGKRHFWFGDNLMDNLVHDQVCNRRVRPSDTRFSIVLGQCLSRQGMPKQGKGCLAVLFHSLRWRLVYIHKLEPLSLKYCLFRSNVELDPEVQVVNFKKELTDDFHFVCIFHKHCDLSRSVKFEMSINQNDGCFDMALCPSQFDARLYSFNDDQHNSPRQQRKRRKKRRGKGGRSGRMEKRSYMKDFWLTIYVNTSKKVSYESQGKSDKVLLLPSSRKPVSVFKSPTVSFWERLFFAVDYDYLVKIPSSTESAERYLLSNALGTHTLIEVETDLNTRFVHCNPSDFQAARSKEGVNALRDFLWEFSKENNLNLPGVPVSMWKKKVSTLNLFQINDVNNIHDAVGPGFGPRERSFCVGINAYFGSRMSSRPRVSPDYGRGEKLFKADYTRAHYSFPEKLAAMEKKLSFAGKSVVDAFLEDNQNYLSFVGPQTCNRSIWTSGTTTERTRRITGAANENQLPKIIVAKNASVDFLGFCNTPHLDSCDMLSKGMVEEWLSEISSMPKMLDYLKKFHKSIGIGLPTTCGYNLLGDKGGANLAAFFCQYNFCMPLGNNSAHHFYGWAFPHCTSLPVLIGKEYRMRNGPKQSPFIIAAWGQSGGKKLLVNEIN